MIRNEKDREISAPWVIVAPGFHRRGGMEKANLELASYLVRRGTPVHLVGYSIDDELASNPLVRSHVVRRFAGSLVSDKLLEQEGKRVIRSVKVAAREARVVVNGGNCPTDDVNWVHYVHHAWEPRQEGAPLWYRAKSRIESIGARRDERKIIPRASTVICNSLLTEQHVIELLGVNPASVKTVYLGAETEWDEISRDTRSRVRNELSISDSVPVALFVGALGYDLRKGFDTMLGAWSKLVSSGWDGFLIVAGGGRAAQRWSRRVEELGLSGSVRLLGFSNRVPSLLAASDVLVSPVRYESYGLNVQEALSSGIPAIVSRNAGVAERYPEALEPLLLGDSESTDELVEKLLLWRADTERWKTAASAFGQELRRYGWKEMAAAMVRSMEEPAASPSGGRSR